MLDVFRIALSDFHSKIYLRNPDNEKLAAIAGFFKVFLTDDRINNLNINNVKIIFYLGKLFFKFYELFYFNF